MPQVFQINGAPMELLDTNELTLIHNNYKPLDTWLLDKFFPNHRGIARDEVPVAELSQGIDVAPLVAPHRPGRPFDTASAIKVEHIKPAYLKPKNTVSQSNNFDLALVNKLRQAKILATGGQALSDQEKWILGQIETTQRNHNSIDNRRVMMAAEYLTTGKIYLESEDYEPNDVSYGRDPALNYTPAALWGTEGAKPYRDVKAMAQLIIDKNGGSPKVLLLSSRNWNYLKADPEFAADFIKPNEGINIPFVQTMGVADGPVYRGSFDGVEVWTLDTTYNLNGLPTRYIPAGYVGLHADTNGYQAQCKIKHKDAGGQPLQYFDVVIDNQDLGAFEHLTESAPLLVPDNKNGWCGGIGFSAS